MIRKPVISVILKEIYHTIVLKISSKNSLGIISNRLFASKVFIKIFYKIAMSIQFNMIYIVGSIEKRNLITNAYIDILISQTYLTKDSIYFFQGK